MNSDEHELVAELDRSSALIFARDPVVADELKCGFGFILKGPERGDGAETRRELILPFNKLFSKRYRICLTRDKKTWNRHGDLIWVCADGQLRLTYPDRTELLPHRLAAIFQTIEARWRWRFFSGSEPAPSPAE